MGLGVEGAGDFPDFDDVWVVGLDEVGMVGRDVVVG